MTSMPEWFRLGEPLIWEVARTTHDAIGNKVNASIQHRNFANCATIHYIHCLNLSLDANRKGQHAVAICLIRQCIEALTVIEIGLLSERNLAATLMETWASGTSSGNLRKQLSNTTWSRYGTGLWNETWTSYFASFSKAVQPYAHYSPELQSWQVALVDEHSTKEQDGSYILLAKVGFDTYEANKATRITCLHCLLTWTLGRVLTENLTLPSLCAQIASLGRALAISEELCKGQIDWPTQFWAHEFIRS